MPDFRSILETVNTIAKEAEEFENLLKAAIAERNEKEAKLKFDKIRHILLDRIRPVDLDWKTIRLDGGHTVQVCLPVRVQGPNGKMYYPPVDASDTWKFARTFNALPLTSAIFDQYHNQSTFVTKSPKHNAGAGTGLHFHTFSEYLNDNEYHLEKKSGAHKLWVLSARGIAVNHGFYVNKPKNVAKYLADCKPLPRGSCASPGGSKLDSSYWLFQNKGAAHNNKHWDYSQLLQLMRSDDVFKVGYDVTQLFIPSSNTAPYVKIVKLREAILEGLPEVWDEPPPKINPAILP
jgi:hypothetical protein